MPDIFMMGVALVSASAALFGLLILAMIVIDAFPAVPDFLGWPIHKNDEE